VQTEALPWLRKAIALDKQQAEAWRELGNAFVVVQQPDSALIAFEQAAVLEPKTRRRGSWPATSIMHSGNT
jgi:cytochrome c-type biogenesis protein CcmH/NrfG